MALEDESEVPLVEPRHFTLPTAGFCAECGTVFSRLSPAINCQQCNKPFCFNCATEIVKLPHSNQEGQVCDGCYFALRDASSASIHPTPTSWSDKILAKFPPEWRSNFRSLVEVAGRMYLPKFIDAVYLMITIVVVGHLGIAELSAFALAKSVITITQEPIAVSVLAPIDCAISQVLASTQDDKVPVVGVWVQRGMVVSVCVGFFLALVWQSSDGFWSLMCVDAEVSDLAMLYLRCSMLGLFQTLVTGVLAVWMLAQGYELPYTNAGVLGLPVHLISNVVLVYGMHLGIAGAALATAVTKSFQLVYIIAHIVVSRLHDRTWSGFSMDAFLPRPLLSIACNALPLALSGMALAFLTQLPLIICAPLGIKELGPFVCLEYITIIFLQVPAALSSATLFKITQHFSSGDGRRAKGTAWLAIWCTLVWSVTSALVMVLTADGLGIMFNHESKSLERVAELMPLSAMWQIWFSLGTTCFAVFESTRDHSYVVYLTFSSAALVTIPCSLLLIKLSDVGVFGILWSMVFSQAASAIFAFFKIKDLNWSAQAESSRRHLLNAMRSTHRSQSGIILQSDVDTDVVMEDAYLYTFIHNLSMPASYSILDDDLFSDDGIFAERDETGMTSGDRDVALNTGPIAAMPLMLLHSCRVEQSRFRALSQTVLQTSAGKYAAHWVQTKVDELLFDPKDRVGKNGSATATFGSSGTRLTERSAAGAKDAWRSEEWPDLEVDQEDGMLRFSPDSRESYGVTQSLSRVAEGSRGDLANIGLARLPDISTKASDTLQISVRLESLSTPAAGYDDVQVHTLSSSVLEHQQYPPPGVLSELETVADCSERHDGSKSPLPINTVKPEVPGDSLHGSSAPVSKAWMDLESTVPAVPEFDMNGWGHCDVDGSPGMNGARMADDDLEALERELEVGSGFWEDRSAALPSAVR